MKTSINLFRRKPQTDYISVNAARLRTYLAGGSIFLFLLFLFLAYQVVTLTKTQDELLKKKETYLRYLLEEKELEANMRYFKSKQLQVNTFLKEDANFLPYYKVLKGSLEETSNQPELDTIDIDKDRNTRFIVKFDNSEDMLSFLRYIESETFLKNFVSLSLQNFNLNQLQSKGSRYQLELRGIFKEINNK